MDIHQQCVYLLKTYSYIAADITHLSYNLVDRIVYVAAGQLQDDGFAIKHNSTLLPFGHELHCNPLLHPSDDDSSDTEADSENAFMDQEQAPVQTCIYGTPHLANRLAYRLISDEYYDSFIDEIDLWSPCSWEEVYQLAHWCVEHNFSRATINELFRNPTRATVSSVRDGCKFPVELRVRFRHGTGPLQQVTTHNQFLKDQHIFLQLSRCVLIVSLRKLYVKYAV